MPRDWTSLSAYAIRTDETLSTIALTAMRRQDGVRRRILGTLDRAEGLAGEIGAAEASAIRIELASATAVEEVLATVLAFGGDVPLAPMVDDMRKAIDAGRPAGARLGLRVCRTSRAAYIPTTDAWAVAAALIPMAEELRDRTATVGLAITSDRLAVTVAAGSQGSTPLWRPSGRSVRGGGMGDPDALDRLASLLAATVVRAVRGGRGVGLLMAAPQCRA